MQSLRDHEKELQLFLVTVLVAKKDDFLSSASRPCSDLVWSSDEPKDRGGQGLGPSLLSYFLSSMGFCQFVHYAEHGMARNLRIDSLEVLLRHQCAPNPDQISKYRYTSGQDRTPLGEI